MSKIAIATMVGQNQGNRLQNYALQHILESMSGQPVETLRVGYGPDLKKRLVKRALFRIAPSKRWARFEAFDNKYIKYSSKYLNDPNLSNSDYDLYVIGSDQVWNPTFSFTSEWEYLPQIKNIQKVSYAASFGVSSIKDDSGRIGKLLRDISQISVREKIGLKIVKDLSGRDAQLVLDPTMLIAIDEWEKIARKPAIHVPRKGYLLKYALGSNIDNEVASAAAGQLELPVIDLNDKTLPIGPAEFLWLIMNATYVCTDSFHASVFSILSHVPFSIFERVSKDEDMSSRFDTLCGIFGLECCRVCQSEALIPSHIDWNDVDLRLNVERNRSKAYLRGCLNGCASH